MIKKNFRRTAIFNLMVTVAIGSVLTFAYPSSWQFNFLTAFIFSNCIGFSIHTLVHLLRSHLERFPTTLRRALLVVLFLIGGSIGTEVGYWIHRALFGHIILFPGHLSLLLFNLVMAIIFGSIAVLYFSLKASAEKMAIMLKEKELQEERLTRSKVKAELDALQSKINPHFLFNTLNSIASLISENPQKAEATVEKLSDLFRYTLQTSQKDSIKLSEELEIVRSYLEIEQVRLEDRLQFYIACEPSLAEELHLPGLIIQPLVENSIRHGIAPKVEGGKVAVDAKRVGDRCVISVFDNGIGFRNMNNGAGHGLNSVQERLNLFYGGRAEFQILHNGGTRIIISIPLSRE